MREAYRKMGDLEGTDENAFDGIHGRCAIILTMSEG